jgi:hypothetical protein
MQHVLSEVAARQFVESYGCAAGPMLRARADLAAERGHSVAAATWREMAEATAAISATPLTTNPTTC